jgi:diaminopimelate epimerase
VDLEFLKCHGSGNDFIIIDEWNNDYSFSEEERKMLAVQLSRRGGPIGSDGILFVMSSTTADVRMRMFNSDGSEAEMCGNGLRCAARYAIDRTGKKELVFETMKADLPVAEVPEIYEGIRTFEVAIEPVSFDPASLPMSTKKNEWINTPIPEIQEDISFTALSVPNPHLAAVVNYVDDSAVQISGERANECKQLFPNGTNVSFIKSLSAQKIFVRTYERGVGLTNACGTAMSASTLVSCLLGHQPFNEVITVYNPGGMVQTIVNKKDENFFIKLRGNATYEFEGTVSLDLENPSGTSVLEKKDFPEEKKLYEKMARYAAESGVQAH